MKAVPEQYRIRRGPLASTAAYGNNGMFQIPHYRIADYFINCIVSDGMGWEHVSVRLSSPVRKVKRCPTWEEMCWVKAMFFLPEECVLQFHPPESEYVNNHAFCLHLWRPLQQVFPLPDSIMVGIKSINVQSL